MRSIPCRFLFVFMALGATPPLSTAFVAPTNPWSDRRTTPRTLISSSSSSNQESNNNQETTSSTAVSDKNRAYVLGLLETLSGLLDKYIVSGNPGTKERCYNVLEQIATLSKDDNLVQQSIRMARRAGLPADDKKKDDSVITTPSDAEQRRQEAVQRQQWEEFRAKQSSSSPETNDNGTQAKGESVRSALGQRATTGKPDLFMNQIDPRLQQGVQGKVDMDQAMSNVDSNDTSSSTSSPPDATVFQTAAAQVSDYVARAGSGVLFDPQTLGIGGLDDVLAQVKRRVWTPLAAPPQLLTELGIHPVRGLLLYGRPGCGKTLLARTLGKILSPLRPITIVSGPEILDKFVGSSEKNLREIFDNPPDIYDFYRIGEADNGEAIAQAALHVIVMDEFDAIARTRGGRGGNGDQGDAGVARDSVVNQMLAKMDGVDPLAVPTLVIGLTNKRSLVEPALLRPGRFEVQIEVPPPKTVEQRVSILQVHTKHMHQAGRLLVKDAPVNTAAARQAADLPDLQNYDELLESLAKECDGFSGASLAGVARAAASHALERAVEDFADSGQGTTLLEACVVTTEDFEAAVTDVMDSLGTSDYADDEDATEADEQEERTANDDENGQSTDGMSDNEEGQQ